MGVRTLVLSRGLSATRRLEQFYGITRGVLQKNLFTTATRHNLVSESVACCFEPLDYTCQIIHFDLNAVPSPWARNAAIRHGLACAARTRPVQ